MAGIASAPLKPGKTYDSSGRIIDSPQQDDPTGQLGDYGSIMAGYGDLAKQNTFQPISYGSSTDVTNALGSLKNLSDTGGYSPEDISAIRERGISPIRSIYANAKQNLNRQRVISGGYSPGYAAALTKMAHDSGQQISDITGNVNAQLAQNIVGNKMTGSQAYGSLASSEASRGLDASEFNANLDSATKNRGLSILDAQRGLYGTTPALADLFSRNAQQDASRNQQNRQFNQSQAQQAALQLIGRRMQSGGYTGGMNLPTAGRY